MPAVKKKPDAMGNIYIIASIIYDINNIFDDVPDKVKDMDVVIMYSENDAYKHMVKMHEDFIKQFDDSDYIVEATKITNTEIVVEACHFLEKREVAIFKIFKKSIDLESIEEITIENTQKG